MFLGTEDLEPFADIPPDKAAAMIGDSEAQAVLVAPCIADLTQQDDAVKFAAVRSILRGAVLRWNDAGSGAITTEQRLTGPFSALKVVDNTKQRRGMFWPSEIQQLQAICNADDAGAFSVDTASTSVTRHADVCAVTFGAAYCSCGADIAGYPIYGG